jgi:D-psicose/D-tagatose/L-ribulose 3-epimerase
MKYGICNCYWSKDWESADYPQKVERARKCGIDIFEIFYGRVLAMEQPEIDEIKAACKANRVEIYCSGGFGQDMDISILDEQTRKTAVNNVKTLITAMGKLGVTNFSGINYAAWATFGRPEDKPKRLEQSAKSLREIGPFAEDHGVQWNMDVINRFESDLLNIAEEGRLLTDMVDHPNVKLLLDIFHGMIEEDDLAEAVRIAGDRLGHYHVGSNNRNLPKPEDFYHGTRLQAIREIGYDKSVSFEPLVHAGGTVATAGGNVWRNMLPDGLSGGQLDQRLIESLAFVKQSLKVGAAYGTIFDWNRFGYDKYKSSAFRFCGQ